MTTKQGIIMDMLPFDFLRNIPFPVFSAFGFNWLDTIILIVFVFYAFEGFAVGFVVATLDLLSFALSFVIGLRFYAVVGSLLMHFFAIPVGFAYAGGFFVAAMVSELFLNIVFRLIVARIKSHLPTQSLTKPHMRYAYLQTANSFLGFIPGICSAIILLAFLLTMVVSLPFSPFLKKAVTSSKIGGQLVAKTQGIEKDMQSVFGNAVSETLNFLTVKPESNETVTLNFKTTDVRVDEQAESQMLSAVNKERTSRGLTALVMDPLLQELARNYSRRMFAEGYFSHYTPDGLSPFDRMARANITYASAGENLALAPDTQLAMEGLMRSPGHKANILSPNFNKIGIGVMDGGIYGEMFTQEFTN